MLAQGFHRMSMNELRELCVTSFPKSTVRTDIMAGFETIYEQLLALGIVGDIWVDGSFLTKKIDPDDIDFVPMIPARFLDQGTDQQKALIEWLINNENDPMKSFSCHTDVGLVYDEDSPFRYLTIDTHRHWEQDVYGYSVGTHEPKGIVIIQLVAAPVPVESKENVPESGP